MGRALEPLPFVSVVVPVRDGAATIAACIDSLLAQTYPKALYEILVVDNGSSDATAAIVARTPVQLLSETAILTSYAARNRGIEHARGEIIAFTDADCFALPDWLMHLVAPFTDPAAGAVLGTIEDAPSQSLAEEFTARSRPFAGGSHRGLKPLVTANAAVRRQTLRDLGGFDELLPTAGDVDLAWRLQQRLGLAIADAPLARVIHRHRSTFRGVFAQYRRYGTSEVLLTTLYRGQAGSLTVQQQRQRVQRQVRALASYVAGFGWRALTSIVNGFDRRRVFWPLFLFVVEAGNLAGKLSALIATRYYRRNPYANPRIERANVRVSS